MVLIKEEYEEYIDKKLGLNKTCIDLLICKNCKFWDYKTKVCSFKGNITDSEQGCANFEECAYDKEKDDQYIQLMKSYDGIIKILKRYCDLNEEYYNIIALWILGTYFHKQFNSFPFLFINATKGSGKSRLLKLISTLSWNGEQITNLSESVIFRSAGTGTLCIDEFEGIGGTDKATLRELLNGSYKKGMCVKRVKKGTNEEGEEAYVIEKFELYCPIAMCNIWGMENVLEDRCISLVLNKSNNYTITKLIENFDFDDDIIKTKEALKCSCVVNVCDLGIIQKEWNYYIINNIYTYNTYTTLKPEFTSEISQCSFDLFKQISTQNTLNGRNLELFFPLFLIAKDLNDEILKQTITTAIKIVNLKKEDDVLESLDNSILDYISNFLNSNTGYIPVNVLTNNFREWLSQTPDEIKDVNSKWVGRALKRLGLVIQKRRIGKGVEVIIDTNKATKQYKIHKPEE